MRFMDEIVNSVADETGAQWAREFLSEHGVAPEPLLLRLVAAARRGDDPGSLEELRKDARRRHRRLALASKLALPTGPVRMLLELYGDTATVIELAGVNGLAPDDAEIAAVMLVLWEIAPALPDARATMAGQGTSLSDLITGRMREHISATAPQSKSPLEIVKALWRLRELVTEAAEAGPKVLGAGAHVNTLTDRALPLLQDPGQTAAA